MNTSVRKGFGFGLTSGVITTLGMMVGLAFSTSSSLYVVAGIAVIAITDALSDAVAIHISEEAGQQESERSIWVETLITFISKFLIGMLFIIPVLTLDLKTAVIFSVIFGLILIGVISIFIAKIEKVSAAKIIIEHLGIAMLVILATGLIGRYIESIKLAS